MSDRLKAAFGQITDTDTDDVGEGEARNGQAGVRPPRASADNISSATRSGSSR